MSEGPSAATTRSGPRRSENARKAVLDAADDLLVERGFAGVSIEGIAARAGVAKQTIYRWWKSKVDILLDTLIDDAETALAWHHGDGDPVAELTAHLLRLVAFLDHEPAGQVLRSLIGHAQHDPATAQRLQAGFLHTQRQRDLDGLRTVLERTGRRPSDAELARLLDRLVGPVYYRLLVLGDAPDRDFIRSHVAATLTTFVT
jgi:AcrR family transcriptional regulator